MQAEFLGVLLIATGFLGMMAGWLARLGRYTYWLRWYDDPAMPFYMRHAALGWMPAGAAFVFLGASILLLRAGDAWTAAGVLSGGLAFGCVLCMTLLTWFAPSWSKPRWLIERDRDNPPATSEDDDRLVAWFVGLVTAALTIVFLAIGVLFLID